MMKKIFLLAGFLIGCFIVTQSYAKEWRIAAVVNDDIISVVDVENRIDLGILVSNIPDDEDSRRKVRTRALASLIDETVREQEAERLKIKVSQNDINNAITDIAAQNGVEPDEFVNEFNKNKSAFISLQKQLHAQIAWTGVVKRVLRPKINISENDIDSAIEDNNRNVGKNEYLVSEIFLNNGVQSNNKNSELAEKLYNEIKSGAPFPVIAQQFSNGVEAANGGVIGWVREDQIDSELKDVITKMPVGALSNPIKTSRGYHIVGLQQKRTIAPLAGTGMEELNIKQIFFPLNADTPLDKRKEIFADIKEIQRTVTSCEAMQQSMEQHTNDITGDLGWIAKESMSAERVKLLSDIGIEKLSRPVPFGSDGFVIMMVCDKKVSEPAQEVREMIANQIGAQRLDQIQQRYVQDLKATAFIDVKL